MSTERKGRDVAAMARAAADLYDETHAAATAAPFGGLARRLHSALGDLADAVLAARVENFRREEKVRRGAVDYALRGGPDLEVQIAAAERAAGARALRDAADDLAVFEPFPGEEAAWLRARADRIVVVGERRISPETHRDGETA